MNHNILDIIMLLKIITNNDRYIPLGDYNQDQTNDILDIIAITKLVLRN